MKEDLLSRLKIDKENEYFRKTLAKVRSNIDIQCPKGYDSYKRMHSLSKHNLTSTINRIQEYEEQRQINYMNKKLSEISMNSSKLFKSLPINMKNSSNRTHSRHKWELLKITQENQAFHKRLIESKSTFKGKLLPLTERKNEKFKVECIVLSEKRSDKTTNVSSLATDADVPVQLLFTKKAYLIDLGLVNIKFTTDNTRFTVHVEPYTIYSDKTFSLVFIGEETLTKIKEHFKNYEEIIRRLYFDGNNILLKDLNFDLTYRTKVMTGREIN